MAVQQSTKRFLAAVLCAAGLMVGCSSPAPESTPAAEAAGTGSPVLVSPTDLRASMPMLDGWTRGEIVAQASDAPTRSTHALATYTGPTGTMELEIADTGGDERSFESLEHMAGSEINRTLDNGYFKGTVIAGFPAVESWNTVDKLGEVSVLVKRRYIIHVAGSGLTDATPMRALAEAVDTSRLR